MYLRPKKEKITLQTVNEIICAYISQNFSAEEENLLIKGTLESFTFNEQAVNLKPYGNEEIYDLKQALKDCKRSFYFLQ